ncbi:Hypothetical protein FKW44_020330, partial [Caligus rogercresseyi]
KINSAENASLQKNFAIKFLREKEERQKYFTTKKLGDKLTHEKKENEEID